LIKIEKILEGIKSEGLAHDRALSALYRESKLQSAVIRTLKSKGLSTDECNVIWTDTIIQFAKLVRNGKYEHQNNHQGYIMNISRFLFLNHIRDQAKHKHTDISEIEIKDEAEISEGLYSNELKQLIYKQLDVLGEMCRKILSLWSRGYKMEEIKDKLNIISNEAVRKRKHKCMKTLLHNVQSNDSITSQLKEYLV